MSEKSVPIAEFLDLVDNASDHQRQMHDHLRDGFMALAREWYRDPSSVVRLSNLAPTKAAIVLDSNRNVVMGKSKVAAVPSAELRRAITSFRSAVQAAVETVHAREKVDAIAHHQVVIDDTDKNVLEDDATSSSTHSSEINIEGTGANIVDE